MNTEKSIAYKRQLQRSYEKGFISRVEYQKELRWIKRFTESTYSKEKSKPQKSY